MFIDGTKIEANANKYTFVWKKSTQKFEAKLQEKILKLIDEINKEFGAEHVVSDGRISVKQL